MAAYAALKSVMHTLQQIQNHPRPPITIKKQHMDSLYEIISFLQNFLENYSQLSEIGDGKKALESQIANAAYAAQDVIEAHIVNQIHSGDQESSSNSLFCQDLQKVIEDMYLIKKEVIEIQEKIVGIFYDGEQMISDKVDSFAEYFPKIEVRLPERDTLTAGLSTFAAGYKSNPVGFDDDLIKIMDRLTSLPADLRIIPIVGMGGVGKTTLASCVYNNPLIVYHFDIRAWTTVSSEYHKKRVIMDILNSISHDKHELQKKGTEQLADILYLSLKGRRYLIVMDDVWDTDLWNDIKLLFPDDHNGSRIILTTRLLELAIHANPSGHVHHMKLLNLDDSWELLREKVFGTEYCPPEFETVGKLIVRHCQGLPLAIVLIGGILSKVWSGQNFQKIAESLAENKDKLMEVLSLSYNYLPNDLKTCFLYMGVFPEDYEISVSQLIYLWVAEGFLEPLSDKSLEEVGSEYLTDLIDRNLVQVGKRSFIGKIKTCSIHSILRAFCIKKAVDLKFLQPLPQGRYKKHPISIHSDVFLGATGHDSPVSSLFYFVEDHLDTQNLSVNVSYRMLKALDVIAIRFFEFPIEFVELVNLRYLAFSLGRKCHLPESIAKLQNLQTLIVFGATLHLPSHIWKMPNLRHLLFDRGFLPYPFFIAQSFGLKHLYTLSQVTNFRCTNDVFCIMPNLKKLGISYEHDELTTWSSYEFNRFVSLHKLESLKCLFIAKSFTAEKALPVNFAFPLNLKRLTLSGCRFFWNYMTIVGSLPHLEVLKLKDDAFQGEVWEPKEEEFLRLRCLLLHKISLKHWRATECHFPALEHITLRFCSELVEIPYDIGNIPTLQIIDLYECSSSAVDSAMQIQEEQYELGNDDLQVHARFFPDDFKSKYYYSIHKVIHSISKQSTMKKEFGVDHPKSNVHELVEEQWDEGVTVQRDEGVTEQWDEYISEQRDEGCSGQRDEGGSEQRDEGNSVQCDEEVQKEEIRSKENLDMSMETIFHNKLYVKDCILYCSVFPTGYEFTKNMLIWLWIAQGLIRAGSDEEEEEECVQCFDKLLKFEYIVSSRYDHYSGQMKYKVSYKMDAFIQNQLVFVGSQFTKELDGKQIDEAKLKHLSLAFKVIDDIDFGNFKKLSHLRTLIIHGCYGSKVKQLPSDLFLELKVLVVLYLGHTNLEELPCSIENSKKLRYLDMSETPIKWLPESLHCLTDLQTLKLDNCLSLIGLPKCMNKLINLRHLVLDVARQLQSMPTGIGTLSKLQTLDTFLVGVDDGCRISELSNMNKLNGSLCILKLENVLTREEAAEASLCDKHNLKNIELQWSDLQDKKNTKEEDILEELLPPLRIQELKILYYSGGVLPSWMSLPSFSEMVSITLFKCRYCDSLPSLGELPSLKFLSIVGMNEVLEINSLFCRKQANQHQPLFPMLEKLSFDSTSYLKKWTGTGIDNLFSSKQANQHQPSFPKLEKLSFDSMSNLKKWTDVESGDFPNLTRLTIEYCPKFVSLPFLSHMNSLLHMEINYCPELASLPYGGLPSTLNSLTIKDCPKLRERCSKGKGKDWSKVAHVPLFYMDNHKVSE